MELHAAVKAKVKTVLVRMEVEGIGEDGELIPMPPRTENQWKGTMEEDDELKRRKARECVGKNNIPNPGTLLSVPDTFDQILNIAREHCNCDAPTHNGIFEHGSSREQVAKKAQVNALVMNLMRWEYLHSTLWLVSLFVLFLAPPVATTPLTGGIEEVGSDQRYHVARPCVDKHRCADGADGAEGITNRLCT